MPPREAPPDRLPSGVSAWTERLSGWGAYVVSLDRATRRRRRVTVADAATGGPVCAARLDVYAAAPRTRRCARIGTLVTNATGCAWFAAACLDDGAWWVVRVTVHAPQGRDTATFNIISTPPG